MFVHKVRELDVLRLQSVRVEVITMPLGVYVHGDPMFSRLAYSCFGPEISPSATFQITNYVGYG